MSRIKYRMKKLPIALAAIFAVCMTAGGTAAQEKDGLIPGAFSANVALTSEYYFRGVSQTDDKPAIQGGFDYEVDVLDGLGVYAGVWGSNVDFNETPATNGANIELDWYGGLRGEVPGVGIGWDVGFIYYWYPGAGGALNYDFVEVQGALSYDFDIVEATASLNYSPDNFGATGNAWYSKFGLTSAPLFDLVTLSAYVARQNVADAANYTEWNAAASVTLGGFDFSIAYTDTTLGNSDDGADAMALFTISRSF